MKTVCIYHSIDLDGWMSAAIVKHWFITNNKKCYINNEGHFENSEKVESRSDLKYSPELEFIGYNYGEPIPDLSEYDKVIMCDVSFPEEEIYKLCVTKDFIWNDHHASALAMYENIRPSLPNDIYYAKGLRAVQYAACELTWKYFFPNEEIPEIVRLLGRYDCFGHKGTDEELKVLEFQYGARQCITNYEEAYDYLMMSIEHISYEPRIEEKIRNAGKAIYSYLCTEAKQTYKNGFEVTLEEENWFESGTIIGRMTDGSWKNRKFICINKERFNPINFGIDYHKDGYDGAACFHYANGMWNFSLYNDNGEVDCSIIAKQYGGGGHKGAAGFKIKNINDIIK